jgi:hypothetical protein
LSAIFGVFALLAHPQIAVNKSRFRRWEPQWDFYNRAIISLHGALFVFQFIAPWISPKRFRRNFMHKNRLNGNKTLFDSLIALFHV